MYNYVFKFEQNLTIKIINKYYMIVLVRHNIW